MKKNVIIISYAYPPNNVAGAQRPYALASYLDKDKYNIKVITCENPDLPIGKNEQFNPNIDRVDLIKIKSYVGNSASKVRSNTDSIRSKNSVFSKLKTFLFNIGQHFVYPDKGMFWYPNVISFLKKSEIINDTDIVFSTSPGVSNHIISRFVKRKNKSIRWIADFRDFNYVEHWDTQKGIKALLHKKLELSIVREATALTFVTKTMQLAYQKFYPEYQNKMNCVYNGFEMTDFPVVTKTLKEENIVSFFYAGSFYKGLRSPFPLLKLLDKAVDDNLIPLAEVKIQIAGNIEDHTKSEINNYKSSSCITYLGNLPRTDVLTLMNEATFLWLIVANIKSHYQTVPIKLFEYIAARRPIVNFAPSISEPSKIIKEKKLGYNFNTLEFSVEESYPIFKELILNFQKEKYKEPLSDLNLKSYTWENQVNMIEKLFE